MTRTLLRSERALQSKSLWALAITAVSALQAVLIISHQPWLDEVQAAQIAIQAPDLPTMLDWLRYEGHPPLWYLLLRAAGSFVEPLWTLKLVALGCAAASQAAILFMSPFTRAERLAFATSQFVLFEFMTVSRSLTLGAATMIVAVALWRRRSAWIAIAILPMCDFLFGAVSLGFAALKLRSRALWLPGAALWLASALLAAWSVIPAADVLPAESSEKFAFDLAHWAMSMSVLLVPWQGMSLPHWNNAPFFLFASWGWAAYLYFQWRQTEGDHSHRWFVFALTVITLLLGTFVYRLFPRHLMIIALLLILLVWRQREQGAVPNPSFRLWLAVASACGLVTGALNLVWPFDRSSEVAALIAEKDLTGKHWVTFPMTAGPTVAALTGIDFERTEDRCGQSFVRWNMRSRLKKLRQVTAYFRTEAQLHGHGYVLSAYDLDEVPATVLRRVGFVPRGYSGHASYLYEFGWELPARGVVPKPCVGGRRANGLLPKMPPSLGKK